jgi:hypothetical protein
LDRDILFVEWEGWTQPFLNKLRELIGQISS